jgi:hypothetical protein
MLLVLLAAVMTSACQTPVRFAPHAPYSASQRFDAPLVIVLPDDIDKVTQTVNMSEMFEAKRFKVFYGEGLKYETVAKLGGMFQGVFLTSEGTFDRLNTEEGKKTADLYSLPESLLEDQGYLLRMSNVRFSFADDRPFFLVDVSFTNRKTGAELFKGTMRGRGTTLKKRMDKKFMSEEIRNVLVTATTSLLNPLAERMRRAIEEEPPPDPVPATAVEDPTAEETSEGETPQDEPPHPRLRPFFVTPQ